MTRSVLPHQHSHDVMFAHSRRRIRRLEKRLGVQLFNRNTRRVALTEAASK